MAKPAKKKKAAKGTEPIAVLYSLDKETEQGAAVRTILAEQGVRTRTVAPGQLSSPVGYFAGLVAYRPSPVPYSDEAPDAPFILLCNLDGKLLDAVLAALRQVEGTITKAMLTKFNRDWSFIQLIAEVTLEAQVMAAAQEQATAPDGAEEEPTLEAQKEE